MMLSSAKSSETLHLHNNPGLEKAPRCLGKLRHLRTLRLRQVWFRRVRFWPEELQFDTRVGFERQLHLCALDFISVSLGISGAGPVGKRAETNTTRRLDGCRATLESLKLSDNELGASVIQEPSELVNGVQRKLRRLPAKKTSGAARSTGCSVSHR